MSNNDIFRKELEELGTSLVFPDASWNWCYNDDCGWYDITLCLTESKTFYRTEIDLSMLDDLPNIKGAAKFAIINLYSIAKGEVS